jgi:hypothetical protein
MAQALHSVEPLELSVWLSQALHHLLLTLVPIPTISKSAQVEW